MADESDGPAPPPTTGVDVVIAEDSRIQARMLQRRLTEAGHTVRWGETGAQALALVKERRPAIIVSDIEMPEMTGYEFCAAVKNDPSLRTVPFILLSTLSDPIDIIRGLDSGADNYVTKPYEPDYLLARMNALLETPLEAADDAAAVDQQPVIRIETHGARLGAGEAGVGHQVEQVASDRGSHHGREMSACKSRAMSVDGPCANAGGAPRASSRATSRTCPRSQRPAALAWGRSCHSW